MEVRDESRRVWWWLLAMAATGVVATMLWLDTYQQDAGNHFLGARWAGKHHDSFIDVWQRPLFVWLYVLPSQLGWNAARVFTVLMCVITAWQTWRLARDLGLARAWLVVPLLWLQTSYFQLYSEVMTEPLHALVLVCALRLHVRGWVKSGMIVASLLVLARPEGFFCGLLWGLWVLMDRRVAASFVARLMWSLLLATGGVLWMAVSWLLTRNALWFIDHWPSNWKEGAYGAGPVWSYVVSLPEIIGLAFIPALVVGLWTSLCSRRTEAGRTRLRYAAEIWLMVFCLHSVLRIWGIMGATGYPRFMVTVAPAGAVTLLAGWNVLASRLAWSRPWMGRAAFAGMFAINVLYVDAWGYSRDARALDDSWRWWAQQGRPVSRLIWSQAYACIVSGRDPLERQPLNDNYEDNMRMLRESGPGTLALWEGETGPAWHKITDTDFAAAGFVRQRSEVYTLGGVFWGQLKWWWLVNPRTVTVHVFYKP